MCGWVKVNPRDGRLRSVGLAVLDDCGEMQLAKREMGLPAQNFILGYLYSLSTFQSLILSDNMYQRRCTARGISEQKHLPKHHKSISTPESVLLTTG